MLLWALLVGLSFPAVGLLGDDLPPLLLTSIRFLIAALALAPLVWRQRDGWPCQRAFFLYAAMGLSLAGFFGAMFWAAHRVSALSMATLFVTVPLLTYCMGRLINVERPAAGLLGILALGACGALGLALAENGVDFSELRPGWGEALFFAGCLASALYPVLTKWGLKHRLLAAQASVRTFWSLAAGALLIGAAGLLWEKPQALLTMRPFDFALVVYLGLFSSAVTFWLQQRATSVLTPAAVTAYSYLVPFVSMLVLFSSHPERVGWHWLPGSLLVIIAIGLLLRRGLSADR